MLLQWHPSIQQHPCQGWHKSWSRGYAPCTSWTFGRWDGPTTSDDWWSIVCALWQPVLLIMTNYVDDVSIILHYYTILHLIFLLVTTCYYNDYYYIGLHCNYLLLHLSVWTVITDSLLHIIKSLLPHYYIIITSLCNLKNSCNNGFIITYNYIGLFRYYIIITHHAIISHYYLLLTGQLADGLG